MGKEQLEKVLLCKSQVKSEGLCNKKIFAYNETYIYENCPSAYC